MRDLWHRVEGYWRLARRKYPPEAMRDAIRRVARPSDGPWRETLTIEQCRTVMDEAGKLVRETEKAPAG